MPAEIVLRAVAVSTNAGAELHDLGDQLLSLHLLEIGVH
jgi:hypothetical protein